MPGKPLFGKVEHDAKGERWTGSSRSSKNLIHWRREIQNFSEPYHRHGPLEIFTRTGRIEQAR